MYEHRDAHWSCLLCNKHQQLQLQEAVFVKLQMSRDIPRDARSLPDVKSETAPVWRSHPSVYLPFNNLPQLRFDGFNRKLVDNRCKESVNNQTFSFMTADSTAHQIIQLERINTSD